MLDLWQGTVCCIYGDTLLVDFLLLFFSCDVVDTSSKSLQILFQILYVKLNDINRSVVHLDLVGSFVAC